MQEAVTEIAATPHFTVYAQIFKGCKFHDFYRTTLLLNFNHIYYVEYYGTALRKRHTRRSSCARTSLEPSSLQPESRSTLGLQQNF